MDCNQAAGIVDANREFFRKKWEEFCQLVEGCAEQLSIYQQRRPRKWTGPAQDDQEWEDAVRKTRRRRERLYARGWVKWGGYDLEAKLQPEDAFCTTYLALEPYAFLSPADVVNPINWLLGQKNPRPQRQEEGILVSCALLVTAHDSAMATINRICPLQGYPGKCFQYDTFYSGIKQRLPSMVKDGVLAEAWDDVRPFLEAGPVEKPGTPAAEAGKRDERDPAAPDVRSEMGVNQLEALDDELPLPSQTLANLGRVPQERLRKRLERLRETNHDCYVETEGSRGSKQPRYLYKVKYARPIIRKLREASEVSGGASGECPATKNLG
jgi:hypothetical protein